MYKILVRFLEEDMVIELPFLRSGERFQRYESSGNFVYGSLSKEVESESECFEKRIRNEGMRQQT